MYRRFLYKVLCVESRDIWYKSVSRDHDGGGAIYAAASVRGHMGANVVFYYERRCVAEENNSTTLAN